ncbi:hypothetical protein PYW07_006917 [Mythimna separata]|uniref:Kazal-like domain-containing protein n=1 Tax=Mythimna separata TaxID=271217 RepID=A0AAD8DZK4_MYTSE|nr:hypothetical protein PYW07_006917 [Mythimna separata]
MTANVVATVSSAGGEAGPPGPAVEDADMKGVEATPEEQERLATGNNNGSLDCKHTPHAGPVRERSVFASTRVFMLVFLSGWVLQGMFLTYFVSVTTTVEKLFKVESKTTGTLLAATEIGQICTALFLTYLAGRGHRPRWIACMMLVLAVGVIGCVLPHLMYGTQLLDVHLDSHRAGAAPVCYTYQNSTDQCDEAHRVNSNTRSNITAVVIPWLFICLLVVGVGQTGIATLGIPYVDDNVGSKQSPLYMAITIGIRVIGPALGFLLGALCTRVYVNPLLNPPDFDASDPRWVGAWWLGMVFIAGFIVLLSALMFCFPRQIRQEPMPPPPKKIKDKNEPFLKDFFATIKRQVTNDILMWRTASSVLHLMPISGVYAFLPKYLEKQFRLPTHDANLVSGLGGILVMGLGTITSGVVILKLVPTARQVAAWTAASAVIYSAGMVVLMFISCPEENYRMISEVSIANSSLDCSSGCYCADVPFNPVCGQDSFTYLSPCQAGCLNSQQLDNSTWLYYNCSCINSETRGDKAMQTYDEGAYLSPCQAGCLNSQQLDNSTWLYYNCSCINSETRGDKAMQTYDEGAYLSPCQAGCLNSQQLDNSTWLYYNCSCINSETRGDKAMQTYDEGAYLSPCQAGCLNSQQLDNSTWLYYNCSCINSETRGDKAMQTYDEGAYLSPCQAGCLNSQQLDNSTWLYYNCSCINSETRGDKAMQTYDEGAYLSPCQAGCLNSQQLDNSTWLYYNCSCINSETRGDKAMQTYDEGTYLSPCQAGCLNSQQLDNSTWLYYNCSCINSETRGDKAMQTYDEGTYLSPCQAGCLNSQQLDNSTWLYYNCSCINSETRGDKAMQTYDEGTYLSPCQAGCLNSQQLDNSTWLYYNCSCINSETRGDKAMQTIERYELFNQTDNILSRSLGFAVSGECGGPCKQIYTFVAVFATVMFVHASGEVGAVLLIIRCTDKKDKAMAMGVIQFAIGVFGNVPCPIVFGAAVDAACRARDVLCGILGACASYDNDSFRQLYLGLSASLMFLAFIMDLLVWSKAGRIDMNPADACPAPDAAPLAVQARTAPDTQL